jgi:hypothetical protein
MYTRLGHERLRGVNKGKFMFKERNKNSKSGPDVLSRVFSGEGQADGSWGVLNRSVLQNTDYVPQW